MPAASNLLKTLGKKPAPDSVGDQAVQVFDVQPPENPVMDLSTEVEDVDSDDVVEVIEDLDEVPIMHGLRRPRRLPGRRPTAAEREPWLQLIERLMGRGVLRPYHMAQLTGVRVQTCTAWMEEIRERWGLAQTSLTQIRRVHELDARAAEIGRVALETALKTTDAKARGTLLRTALEADARRAALAGLDKKTIEHHHQHSGKVEKRTTIALETSLGLAPGALEQIGRVASLQLTDAARARLAQEQAADVVDVEFEPSEPYGDTQAPAAVSVSPAAPRAPSKPRPKAGRPSGGSSPTTKR
jgi:hypothetical protein